MPDPIVINKLVWSAMAALDQANQTGNYSVLRDLGAPSFQTKIRRRRSAASSRR
ncbi:MAG TPA: hypothetical protein VEA61_00330 [Allosphingosinicella sp.]|nr:hypothetical protein [Allosphingosinicella sp.]